MGQEVNHEGFENNVYFFCRLPPLPLPQLHCSYLLAAQLNPLRSEYRFLVFEKSRTRSQYLHTRPNFPSLQLYPCSHFVNLFVFW